MPKNKSKNPAHPKADPTAPGGMSKAALRIELAEEHGVPMDESRETSWPDLIDAVVEGRKTREAARKIEDGTLVVEDWEDPVIKSERLTTLNGQVIVLPETDDADEDSGLDAHQAVGVTATNGLICACDEEFADEAAWSAHLPTDPVVSATYCLIEDCEAPTYGDLLCDEHSFDREENEKTAVIAAEREVMAEQDDLVFDPEQMFAEMKAARDESTPPPLFIGLPGIKDYVFSGHAGAGPSSSERWMHCTMSLSASRAFLETLSPNQQAVYAGANTAARQGTTAHSAAEVEANLILGRTTQEEADHTLLELAVMPEVEDEAYDDEMAEFIAEYVDLVKSYADERGEEHVLIEARVEAAIPLSDLHEGEVYIIRGSGDCVVMPTAADPTLVVIDLKYGSGIEVDVEENTQEMIYALGALDLLVDDEGNLITDVEKIVLHIAQPRLGGLKTWSLTLDELFDWRDDVLSPALTKALYGHDEGATYNPGETACQFCPARGSCPALTESRIAAAADLFDVIVESEFEGGPGSFPETESLSDTRLGELLSQVAGLIDIHKDLKEEAQRRLHRGDTIPGYQLVNYTPPRKWSDEAAEELADTELWVSKLVSPTAAEKMLDKEEFANIEALVVKPDKRPVIAKEGDRRSKWTGTPPEQMFADETETKA